MDLTQENYELRQKLDLAQAMERTYLEELEILRENVRTLQLQQSDIVTRPDTANQEYRVELEERLEHAEERLTSLTAELRLSKEREAQLHEKLSIAECRLEAISSEASLSTIEPNQPDPALLVEEVARLNEELDTLKTNHRIECAKLERHLAELEEEKLSLQSDVGELQHHLKESREELSDIRAQLEAVELQQASEASKTRGNSAFSELEDRRVRAEELVKKQRSLIEDLRAQLVSVQAESTKKLEEELRKLETRFRERDMQFTDNLVAERRRLMDENRTLQLQLQQFEELQVDNERRASTVSKAFNLRGSGQESLVNTLERRIALLQRRLAEKTTLVDGLRDRMLKAHYMRRQMQTELWNQMDITTRLSEQLQKCQKQWMASKTPLKPVSDSNKQEPQDENSQPVGGKKDNVPDTATNLKDELRHEIQSENNPIALESQEEPPKTKQSTANVIHLNKIPSIQTKGSADAPPDCKTS